MTIKLERIEKALNRIEAQKKDEQLKSIKASLDNVKEVIKNNPLAVNEALCELKEVFDKMAKIHKNDHSKVYAEFDGSLKDAIKEHMFILTSHAEEVLEDLTNLN